MKALLIGVSLLLTLLIVYDAVVIFRALARGRDLAAASSALSHSPSRERGALLIVGDSTAVGTGASDSAHSIAGRLATDFPALHIDNLAVNGAVYSDVSDQLSNAPRPSYDAVLIQAGGNDILRFTPAEELGTAIAAALDGARRRGDRVVLLATGDVGAAPSIPFPLGPIFTWRSVMLRNLLVERAEEDKQIAFVDLLGTAGKATPFSRQPDTYYAKDGLHPSGAGYGLWYQRLRENVTVSPWLAGRESAD